MDKMTPAQRAYEEKRAKKAGKSLDAWMVEKGKREAAAAKLAKPAPAPPSLPKKPGFFSRLLERANKPIP